MVLWSKSHRHCQEIHSSVHRSAAGALCPQKHFTDTLAVQFSRVRIANTNQQQWHDLAETARPWRDQEVMPGEVLHCAFLDKEKISEDSKPTSI
jgi:Zn ribbon nucleic-acid-binding protein